MAGERSQFRCAAHNTPELFIPPKLTPPLSHPIILSQGINRCPHGKPRKNKRAQGYYTIGLAMASTLKARLVS